MSVGNAKPAIKMRASEMSSCAIAWIALVVSLTVASPAWAISGSGSAATSVITTLALQQQASARPISTTSAPSTAGTSGAAPAGGLTVSPAAATVSTTAQAPAFMQTTTVARDTAVVVTLPHGVRTDWVVAEAEPAVSEPITWVYVLGLFVLFGFMLRRRLPDR